MSRRIVAELVLAAGVAFVVTLGPLWSPEAGFLPPHYFAAGGAALTSALALLRQQPRKP